MITLREMHEYKKVEVGQRYQLTEVVLMTNMQLAYPIFQVVIADSENSTYYQLREESEGHSIYFWPQTGTGDEIGDALIEMHTLVLLHGKGKQQEVA